MFSKPINQKEAISVNKVVMQIASLNSFNGIFAEEGPIFNDLLASASRSLLVPSKIRRYL